MKKHNHVLQSLLVVGLLSTLAIADDEVEVKSSIQIPEHASELNVQKSATIGVEKVVQVLKAAYPNEKIVSISLENEDGNLIYEAEVLQNNLITEVIVDAGNGKILASKIDEEDDDWYKFW